MDTAISVTEALALEADQLPAPTVAKTMAVIEAVGQRSDGLTQAEVIDETGCSANFVYRVLSTLVTIGYMNRREDDRRYVLTSRLLEGCRPRVVDKSLVLCAEEGLRWLRDRTRETVQLVVEAGGKGVVLEQFSGLEPVQVMGRVGMRVPLYSCAPGKAILAFMSEAARERWFSSVKLKSFTANTKSTREELDAAFEQIRRLGYAEDWEEGLEGIRCVAAPIFDAYQQSVGALTVMSPAKRLPQRRFAELGPWCVKAANKVRDQLLS